MHSTPNCYLIQSSNPQRETASRLYARARSRGQRGQLWASLSGRSRRLLALGEVGAASLAVSQSKAGTHTVSIDLICGSESRSADFDRDFSPLGDQTRDRWLSIAEARERGRALPPVALIQIGERYFVRDGHHRVSVARALGQRTIEANVIVRQVNGPLPWETPADPAGPGFGRLISKLRHQAARLNAGSPLSAAPASPATLVGG